MTAPEPESVSVEPADDARRAVSYLVAPESTEYIAIMGVLEASSTDLTPPEVASLLRSRGVDLDLRVVEARLTKLHEWTAVSARSDQSHVRRVQDLLFRNFRYTATRQGRQVQRFYDTVLAGTTVMREIPLQSLNQVVTALEALAGDPAQWDVPSWFGARVNQVFTAHDDLDASLVGAEDTLMGLADRFDLDDSGTGELKRLLIGYATRVTVELDRGADRATRALLSLAPSFDRLAELTIAASEAAELIGRDLLAASKGGSRRDWLGLRLWFDPARGRAARFQSRMVRAIPTFHANLRRLHTAGESGTSKARALALARACLDPDLGPQLYLAALGDHSWRKFHGEADDPGAGRIVPWRDGPQVAVPPGLRTNGRSGVRGRAPAPLDDRAAKETLEAARRERLAQHREYLLEILAAEPGQTLSQGAARVALACLMDAVRQTPRGDRRRAVKDGLACSIFFTGAEPAVLRSPTWKVWLPQRAIVFHSPQTRPQLPAMTDPGGPVAMYGEEVVA
ncbi:MAG: DUF2397 domain-containing protein [Propionicimonas sp.]|uniref:DUF2397 domain-containing protein n=1 Tax=Propionicimonas sp. TaxID=1955623 RepID=UPI002B216D9A|nr:DUF2397 domain-containing protein [Propionicimonas sp.]MEA4945709.1 DUF2397 domain-containing protein [Propionicimonas sp.]MEA5053867.1 DUF2397 domain-containing protein [Propionicimonas sp.]